MCVCMCVPVGVPLVFSLPGLTASSLRFFSSHGKNKKSKNRNTFGSNEYRKKVNTNKRTHARTEKRERDAR